jgi:hypothetical protein
MVWQHLMKHARLTADLVAGCLLSAVKKEDGCLGSSRHSARDTALRGLIVSVIPRFARSICSALSTGNAGNYSIRWLDASPGFQSEGRVVRTGVHSIANMDFLPRSP